MIELWLTIAVLLAGAGCQEVSDVEEYRLPGDLVPSRYKLTVTADPAASAFFGEVEISFSSTRPTSRVLLNVDGLRMDGSSLALMDPAGRAVRFLSVAEDARLQRLSLVLDGVLTPGALHRLFVRFAGDLDERGVGFYKSSYLDPRTGQTRWLGVTQLRPVHARKLFPCFDEPVYRAKFLVSIEHPPNYNAISNMPVSSVERLGNNTVTIFEETPSIPPFLVGFMVSELDDVTNGAFSSYAVPSKISGAEWAASVGPSLAAAASNHLGLPYPHLKTDLVALPRLLPVAMENWGLFTFREENVLYFDGVSTNLQRQNVPRFIAHEVAHAWMGNPVTIAWWDYLWLSEVFAMYYEYYIPSLVEPSWKMRSQMVVDLHQGGLLDDSQPTDPLTTTVRTPQEISDKFSGVTYSKGPALLRMIIHAITEAEFLKGFRSFLITNSYSAVEPDDLWANLHRDELLPANLSVIMDPWTTLPGYPVVRVVRNYTTGTVTLTQTTFKLDETAGPDNKTWWIPLSYTTSREAGFEGTLPKMWFPPQPSQQLHMPLADDDWVLFNVQSTGFYRTNYDQQNWENILRQLERDHNKIHPLSRCCLLDDALNLARAGQLNYATALRLGCYLRRERSFAPWKTATNAFGFLDEILLHSPLHRSFKGYMLTLLKNAYERVGFDEAPGDSHLKKLSREIIVRWACRMGHPDCIARSLQYVNALAQKPYRISVDVRETALCTGVAEGSPKEWDLVLSLYDTARQEDKPEYLSALACTKDPQNIYRFLFDSVNEASETEWNARFAAMARRKENSQALLDMLVGNFERITNRFGDGAFVGLINRISRFLTTPLQENALSELEDSGLTGLTDSRNGIRSRADWLDRYSAQLDNAWNGYKYKTFGY